MDRTMSALVRRMMPRQGTVTCGVSADESVRLHGEPCLWRGSSLDSAARHIGSADRADERARGVKMTGRARGRGHVHVSARSAGMRDTIALAVGTIRAEAAVAAEEESE
jgi:hypothetical protein